jgi:hypothetical protein
MLGIHSRENVTIKLFRVGTAHMEVHPEVARQLNLLLAATYAGKDIIDGFVHEWSEVFEVEFENTAARVVILTLQVA